MTAISVTAANVIGGEGAKEQRVLGGTVTAGQHVRVSSGAIVAGSNNTAAAAAVHGIALNGGAAGQPVVVQRDGLITIGGTVAVGEVYVAGADGAIEPKADQSSGDYVTVIGIGVSATQIRLVNAIGGVAIPP